MKRADVIVVGAGALGSSAAFHAARTGRSVIVIDRFVPPHAHGSSHGNTRLIRKAYFEGPKYIPLIQRSYELWKELEDLTGQKTYHPTGLLIVSDRSGSIAEKIRTNASTHNLEIELLDSGEIARRFPQFHVDPGDHGILEKDAGFLEVEPAIQALLNLAKNHGAQFQWGEIVTGWSAATDNVSVITDKATYEADSLILAPGAWSSSLIKEFEMKLTVTRAPQFWFEGKPHHNESEGMPCFAFSKNSTFIYGFPNREPLGVKVANYAPSSVITDPLARDPHYTSEELAPIALCIERHLPGVSSVPRVSNICMYTLTKDDNFVIDRHPNYPNVLLATGESGHAFKFAPVIGEILARWLAKQTTSFDLEFLRYRP